MRDQAASSARTSSSVTLLGVAAAMGILLSALAVHGLIGAPSKDLERDMFLFGDPLYSSLGIIQD